MFCVLWRIELCGDQERWEQHYSLGHGDWLAVVMDPTTSSTYVYGRSAAVDQLDDWDLLPSVSAGSLSQEMCYEDRVAGDKSKLKSKLVSAWNSVKYGQFVFFIVPYMLEIQTINLLTIKYSLMRFRRSFASFLWLTYRRGFPQLPGSSLTTDSGWGCVLRTGQMLLAHGLLIHLMPADWTWPVRYSRGRKLSVGSLLDRPMEATHRRVVGWFADHPTAPFGIHKLVELGQSSGKKAGDWYGPSIVAHILKKAVAASVDLPNLVIYVAQDCTIFITFLYFLILVYLQDVRGLCERPLPQSWKSVIVLVPVRLGGQELNPSYIPCVKKLLMLQCCIGIIGGKPKHSLFFVGFQDDHLLYLDPHYCQPAVNIKKDNFPLESFHCKQPRKMAFSRMDPSCTIGFYAKDQSEFELMCAAVNEVRFSSCYSSKVAFFIKGAVLCKIGFDIML
uniref:Cysteine protease n=1 Tax=Xiphophorus couchianus TaxID=32473 RepID=A0A3B5M9A6_9TELE